MLRNNQYQKITYIQQLRENDVAISNNDNEIEDDGENWDEINDEERVSQYEINQLPHTNYDDEDINDTKLADDQQQHSIDGFFDGEIENDGDSTSDKSPNSSEINTVIEHEATTNIDQIEAYNISEAREANTPKTDDKNDTRENETEPMESQTADVRRSNRANKGQIERMVMDHGGKDYRSYRAKQLAQVINNKRMQRRTLKSQVTLFMRKTRETNGGHHVFFQAALKTLFLSPQMSARRGIKEFGQRAVAAMLKEFTQLDQGAFPGKPVVEPVKYSSLTEEEKRMAMEAISLIKEKRGGTVKGRTCADGSDQHKYLHPDDTVASPTVSNEGMLGTFMIDAYEAREMGVFDIPGAYLHAEIVHKDDHRILLVLRDEFVDMMCEVNPKYIPFVEVINGRKVLYLKLLRALYGCIESALLWYKLFSGTLQKMGFTINPYDRCVANKMIDGHQCTIVWYVDDAKISHKSRKVIEEIFIQIQEHFGKMDITYGNEQEYLGMLIKVKDRKITVDM